MEWKGDFMLTDIVTKMLDIWEAILLLIICLIGLSFMIGLKSVTKSLLLVVVGIVILFIISSGIIDNKEDKTRELQITETNRLGDSLDQFKLNNKDLSLIEGNENYEAYEFQSGTMNASFFTTGNRLAFQVNVQFIEPIQKKEDALREMEKVIPADSKMSKKWKDDTGYYYLFKSKSFAKAAGDTFQWEGTKGKFIVMLERGNKVFTWDKL